jgi:hypothetical protein
MSTRRARSASIPTIRSLARVAFLFAGALSIAGCDSNPDGPRVPRPHQAEERTRAADNPPLPKQGRDNPRGLQYAQPD